MGGGKCINMMRGEKRKNENEKNDSFSPQNLTVMTFWAEETFLWQLFLWYRFFLQPTYALTTTNDDAKAEK